MELSRGDLGLVAVGRVVFQYHPGLPALGLQRDTSEQLFEVALAHSGLDTCANTHCVSGHGGLILRRAPKLPRSSRVSRHVEPVTGLVSQQPPDRNHLELSRQ